MGFTINEGRDLIEVHLLYSTYGSCHSAGSATFDRTPPPTVSNGKMSAYMTIPFGLGRQLILQFNGQFDDSAHASGILNFYDTMCGSTGDLTWSATKE